MSISYDAFISYSRGSGGNGRDKAFIVRQTLANTGINVYTDVDSWNGNKPFNREIEEVISNVTILLVIWNKEASESEWVADELNHFMSTSMKNGGVIFVIQGDDTQLNVNLSRHKRFDFTGNIQYQVDELIYAIKNVLSEKGSRTAITNLTVDDAMEFLKHGKPNDKFQARKVIFNELESGNLDIDLIPDLLRIVKDEQDHETLDILRQHLPQVIPILSH